MMHQQGNSGKEGTHKDGHQRRGVEIGEGKLTMTLIGNALNEPLRIEVVEEDVHQSYEDEGVASPEHPTAVAVVAQGHEDEGVDEIDGGRRPVDPGVHVESSHCSCPALRGDEGRDGRHHQECQPCCYLQSVERYVLSSDFYFHAAKIYINSETTKFLY